MLGDQLLASLRFALPPLHIHPGQLGELVDVIEIDGVHV
jgi:hypothetical protein